ncbi:MAG: hypothetical protein JOZ08_21695 [Verrucomicrobia bacterium]|nr:hypothetical protein [Verrucomicrobiota bacterium]MBV8277740.1 hypothetical protein [Verrucomicrobiota bacterium]
MRGRDQDIGGTGVESGETVQSAAIDLPGSVFQMTVHNAMLIALTVSIAFSLQNHSLGGIA